MARLRFDTPRSVDAVDAAVAEAHDDVVVVTSDSADLSTLLAHTGG